MLLWMRGEIAVRVTNSESLDSEIPHSGTLNQTSRRSFEISPRSDMRPEELDELVDEMSDEIEISLDDADEMSDEIECRRWCIVFRLLALLGKVRFGEAN